MTLPFKTIKYTICRYLLRNIVPTWMIVLQLYTFLGTGRGPHFKGNSLERTPFRKGTNSSQQLLHILYMHIMIHLTPKATSLITDRQHARRGVPIREGLLYTIKYKTYLSLPQSLVVRGYPHLLVV